MLPDAAPDPRARHWIIAGRFRHRHSSLAYLQRFPFDTIKIDQSFVRTTSRGTRPVILKSIIALAHDLGMDVVAEGAETDSDAVELYQLAANTRKALRSASRWTRRRDAAAHRRAAGAAS